MWNWRYKKKVLEEPGFPEEDLALEDFVYDFSLVKLTGSDIGPVPC